MINEILCASLVRIRIVGWFVLVATCIGGCGATASPMTEADLNAAVRRVQVHEAAISACPCAASARHDAARICDEAKAFADADLRARCDTARRATEPGPNAVECACD